MPTLSDICAIFESQLNKDTLHHAWIIEGQRNLGKKQCVEGFLNILIPGLRLSVDWTHPSFQYLDRMHDKNVESIRQAIQFLQKTTWDGSWKVCVVDGSEELTLSAQNAFLKMMEEPCDKTIIILISDTPNHLLSTLYSRAMHFIVDTGAANYSADVPDSLSKEIGSYASFVKDLTRNNLNAASQFIADKGLVFYEEVLHQCKNIKPGSISSYISHTPGHEFLKLSPDMAIECVFILFHRMIKSIACQNNVNLAPLEIELKEHLVRQKSLKVLMSNWEDGLRFYKEAKAFKLDSKDLFDKICYKLLQQG